MSGIKARPTLYKGIQMRSRLEADFAAFLDRNGAEWQYEPTCFAGPDGQWLPDFCVLSGESLIYFEVKPESLGRDQIDPTLERMAVAWLTDPAAILQLVIWSFGDPLRSRTLMGIPPEDGDDARVWWYSEGSGDSTLWPGMGQFKRVIEQMPLDELERMIAESAPGGTA